MNVCLQLERSVQSRLTAKRV